MPNPGALDAQEASIPRTKVVSLETKRLLASAHQAYWLAGLDGDEQVTLKQPQRAQLKRHKLKPEGAVEQPAKAAERDDER